MFILAMGIGGLFIFASGISIMVKGGSFESAAFNFILGIILIAVFLCFLISSIRDVKYGRSSGTTSSKSSGSKQASVIKRGIVGTVIGGVPGAIIGAASAIDHNNRNKK